MLPLQHFSKLRPTRGFTVSTAPHYALTPGIVAHSLFTGRQRQWFVPDEETRLEEDFYFLSSQPAMEPPPPTLPQTAHGELPEETPFSPTRATHTPATTSTNASTSTDASTSVGSASTSPATKLLNLQTASSLSLLPVVALAPALADAFFCRGRPSSSSLLRLLLCHWQALLCSPLQHLLLHALRQLPYRLDSRLSNIPVRRRPSRRLRRLRRPLFLLLPRNTLWHGFRPPHGSSL